MHNPLHIPRVLLKISSCHNLPIEIGEFVLQHVVQRYVVTLEILDKKVLSNLEVTVTQEKLRSDSVLVKHLLTALCSAPGKDTSKTKKGTAACIYVFTQLPCDSYLFMCML